jgi:hypothetical protein
MTAAGFFDGTQFPLSQPHLVSPQCRSPRSAGRAPELGAAGRVGGFSVTIGHDLLTPGLGTVTLLKRTM